MKFWSGRFRILGISAIIFFIIFIPSGLTASPTGDPALDESLTTLAAQVGDGVEPFVRSNLALRFNQPLSELMDLHRSGLDVGEIFLVSWIAVERGVTPSVIYSEFVSQGREWKSWLESAGLKKGSKAYKKLYQASVNIHPKPYFPGKH